MSYTHRTRLFYSIRPLLSIAAGPSEETPQPLRKETIYAKFSGNPAISGGNTSHPPPIPASRQESSKWHILCNAGGVTVSYLEWVQNRTGYYWAKEQVITELKRIIEKAFADVLEASKAYRCSMRIAAYIVAIKRVTRASEIRGLYA